MSVNLGQWTGSIVYTFSWLTILDTPSDIRSCINNEAPSLFLIQQIPEEEKNLGPQDRLIHVYHFTKESGQNQMVWFIDTLITSFLSNGCYGIERFPGSYTLLHLCPQQQVQNFGEPFFLVIHEGETLAQVKTRIQKKLQVPDEEFAKWKFAFLSLGRPEYLQDSDVVFTRFQRRDVYGAWEQYLGLEHPDNTPKRSYAVNQNRHTFEKPVKIYN
ncbi:hypothetical protein POTOM_025960 [Populus tomentosa]|uniref:ubiquitinyl hydrolase 1 n=1 Tax=Populus tomentosa TaxID=118781 RepID=A0A8X7ZQ23_POPTO|nr:hypothetical protein POTOM_025960 [Populus tomentosa]